MRLSTARPKKPSRSPRTKTGGRGEAMAGVTRGLYATGDGAAGPGRRRGQRQSGRPGRPGRKRPENQQSRCSSRVVLVKSPFVRAKKIAPGWRKRTMAKGTAKAPSKGQVYLSIAEKTGLNKKQVASVMDALSDEVTRSLNRGAGLFAIPGPREDREEEGPGAAGTQGRAEPVQAGRDDGRRGQAREHQDQGPRPRRPRGNDLSP